MSVPPVLQAVIAAGVMSAISMVDKQQTQLLMGIGILLCFLGVGLAVLGVWQFKQHHTTVNPLKPQNASNLVTSGIYAYTRNPMYVGMVFVLIGWALWLGSALSLIIIPVFMLSMTYLQIKKEEQALKSLFGDEYIEYYYKTRRWL